MTYPVATALDDDDCSAAEVSRGGRQYGCESVLHLREPWVPEPEEDDAWRPATSQRDQVGEVQVERQNDSCLRDGLLENAVVLRALETFIAEVDGIVALGA